MVNTRNDIIKKTIKKVLKNYKNKINVHSDSDSSNNDSDFETESDTDIDSDSDLELNNVQTKQKIAKPKIKLTMCYNKLCDHKKHTNVELWNSNNPIKLTSIESLNDLIILGECQHCKMRPTFNGINLNKLCKLKDALTELKNMIGLKDIKEQILNNIITFFSKNEISTSNMLHSIITGGAGCGKTTFIEILSKIYKDIGILKKGHIVRANRTNLIGKYLGETALKTKECIMKSYGGILLIDEVYQLGSNDNNDSFAKECVDTLNQQLSEIITDENDIINEFTGEIIKKEDRFFICFIAGYKNAIDNNFFSQNEGLRRRFPFRYDIEPYTSNELTQILFNKIKTNLSITSDFPLSELNLLVERNKKYFVNQGGDMQTLYLKIIIQHTKRVFLLPEDDKKILKIIDVKNATDEMVKYIKSNTYEPPFGLYT